VKIIKTMANKLLKHFGFSSKKVSSQQSPSHHEYSAKTSSSVHELHSSRTPTKTRSSTNVIPTVRGSSADGRRHSDASAVRGSVAGARSAARSRGMPGTGGWTTLSRDDGCAECQTARQTTDAATIASSSVRGRRPPRVDSLTHDDLLRRSRDNADPSCPVRLHVTSSISSDNLTVRYY